MLLLLTAALLAGAAAAPGASPLGLYYHESVGIELTARIKAAEEAMDFDGGRIVGGTVVPQLGLYPFMAGLVILLSTGQQSSCGASLLSNTRAVTAAHCWNDGRQNARQFTVVLGSLRLHSGGRRVATNRVDVHPQWNFRNLHNDIAVIHISHVAYTTHINRINLPTGSSSYVGTQVNAVGFGFTSQNSGVSPVLRHVRVPVVSNADCARAHGAAFVVASTLCTSGAGGRGTCFGDSGGPLQAPGNVLVGVTSFVHHSGCTTGQPAGFARVTSFAAWIRQRM